MKIKTAAVLSLLCLGATACHDSAADLAPGTYSTKTSSTDAAGTAHDANTTTNVSIDQNGNKQVDTTTKTSTDPKGLFNKTTNTTSNSATYPQQ